MLLVGRWCRASVRVTVKTSVKETGLPVHPDVSLSHPEGVMCWSPMKITDLRHWCKHQYNTWPTGFSKLQQWSRKFNQAAQSKNELPWGLEWQDLKRRPVSGIGWAWTVDLQLEKQSETQGRPWAGTPSYIASFSWGASSEHGDATKIPFLFLHAQPASTHCCNKARLVFAA